MTARPAFMSGTGPRVALLFAAMFGANAAGAYMPLWFADRGLSPEAIGQILGAASLFRVIAGPGWGTVADRLGRRRPVMVVAAGAAAAMSLAYIQARGFAVLLMVAAMQGMASAAIGPLVDSLALALSREEKMEYGPVRAWGSASFMVMTAATGSAMSLLGSWIAPWLQAAGYGLAALAASLVPEAAAAPARAHALGGLDLFRLRPFRHAVACTALIQGSHAAFYGFAALYWRSQGIGDAAIGLLFAECIVAEILLFARGRRLIAYLGPAGLTTCAALACVARWTAMAFAPPLPVLAVIQLLHAATFAMQHLSAMLILTRVVPPERAATAQSLHSALGYGAPTGLAMLLSGWLYASHAGGVFLAMAGLAAVALLLVRPLRRSS